jgi:transposase
MTDPPENPPSTAAQCQPARCLFAIELSKASWLVACMTPLSSKISRHQCKAGDAAGLIELMRRLQARAEKALGRPVEIVSCYEAGFDGFWLHRRLDAEGVRNLVLDPASLQVNRRARRAKTDRIDAETMLRALLAHLRGEPKVLSVVRVPSVADEDAKRPHRERERLVHERIAHGNRITGLCATQGIYDYQPLRRDRRQRLEALMTGDGRPLPKNLKAEIEHELKRLELILGMIKELEAKRDAVALPKKAGSVQPEAVHPNVKKIRELARFKSIGAEFATRLTGEVFYRSFNNRRQLAGYVGLDTSPFCSGGMEREQGISKAGNPRARSTMIELAWLWLRYQPDSALSRWFRERVGDRKGRIRRISIVAMARKLLIALWRYLETGLIPEGAVFKA